MKPTTASVVDPATRWLAGDVAAGNELIRQHDSWITALARRKTLPWEDVDDTAQVMRMAFADAAKRIAPDFSDKEARRFLYLAMTRTLQDERDIIKSPTARECDEEIETASLGNTEASAEASMVLSGAALSADELGAVVAREILEKDGAEYGREIGVHHSKVQRLLTSGMAKLRVVAGVETVAKAKAPGVPGDHDPMDARLLEFLVRNGPSDGSAIRGALGVSRFVLWRATTRLRARGVVLMQGEGRSAVYSVAAKAEAA